MGINLVKGQKINLKKDTGHNGDLSSIVIGLGWDANGGSGGILGTLFGSGGGAFDLDASCVIFNSKKELVDGDKSIIYYGNLKSKCSSIVHTGDNLTGDGDGDDEQIKVNLEKLNSDAAEIYFFVNIYSAVSRKQHFGMVKNAYIRIYDEKTKTELAKFNLTENYDNKISMIMGKLYNHNNEWKFNAIGNGGNDKSVKDCVQTCKNS